MDAAADTLWGKTTENDDDVALSAMLHTEDRGAYAVLASFMSRLGKRLLESSDSKIRTAYLELANRAEEAFKYEAKHGRRSLMKWDHPDNVEWVRIGLIRLSENDRRAFKECNGFAVALRVKPEGSNDDPHGHLQPRRRLYQDPRRHRG